MRTARHDHPPIRHRPGQPETTETPPMQHKSRSPDVGFKGQKHLTATQTSVTDRDARLYQKSSGAGAMLASSDIP